MAKNAPLVFLGYDDEPISDKQKSFIDLTVNKIGGKANWPSSDIIVPLCPLCGLNRPLIVQIYAPLENSQFHRTLYAFACVNPMCSVQSKGWICVRAQQLEKHSEKDSGNKKKRPEQRQQQQPPPTKIAWCTGGDEWNVDYDDYGDDGAAFGQQKQQQQQQPDDNMNEQNGNIVALPLSKNENRIASDEDEEESVSMESDPIPMFGNLRVAVADDKNANCEGQGGGAMGVTNASNAFAEIEGEETDVVTIDHPMLPEQDLIAMLKQTTALPTNGDDLVLNSYFIAVDEERKSATSANEHVRELVNEYQRREEKVGKSPSSPGNLAAGGGAIGGESDEKYEKAVPMHGDLMFYNYLEQIQQNPGQILRYSRNSLPLLIAPLTESIPLCPYCGNELLCEIQILSTLISKLAFVSGDPCPIEYGNVLIFTCTKSCWDTPDKMRLEHVIVQRET